ncbi:hypothetical protein F0L68_39720 [Solihabitans fulvus]|uniref:FtsK domain-containing protein n=1 Tax=Solihabitans fulvus TaxID=1892852 RepID=A0A5B2W9S4_9PSEU|nr:hypothetical protein [Solihabitans fulvus]KAA2248681.1 hypothetical protein F0L68_39720 [Solihabitans fulvus]
MTTQLETERPAPEAVDVLPDELAADHTATADEQADQSSRSNRRARAKVERHLLKDVEQRNRKQLLPHYITAGLVGLAEAIHALSTQAQAAGVAALLTGLACTATGTAGYRMLRRREKLLQSWALWSTLLATATSVWMVVAVLTGVTWGSLALALAADYAFGARWWARHRHPAPVAPTVPAHGEPAAAPVEVDESQIAIYPRRWADYVGGKGCLLDGSHLTGGTPFEHGIEYALRLHRGKHDLDMVLSNLSKIATGLGHPASQLIAEEFTGSDDPALARLRVVLASPVKQDVFFREPQFADGSIVLGPYADGVGSALWRLYTEDSMWGGMVIGGTGSGKSRLLEVIGLVAMFTGLTYVIHVDGQDGASCPQLWKHAHEHYGSDEVGDVLTRLTAMQHHRQRNRPAGDPGFTPSPDYPGILVIVDEAHVVITKETVMRWAALAREARKVGLAIVMGDQDGSLETFIKSVLRGSLRAGNAVGLKTDERAQGQIMSNGKFNLHDLPAIPGFGHTLGEASRHAPFKGKFLPSRKNAKNREAEGKPLPKDLLLVEDWYERARHARVSRLDTGTALAGDHARRPAAAGHDGGQQDAEPHHAAQPAQAGLPKVPQPTRMGLPSVRRVAKTSVATEAPALSGSQQKVLRAVRAGFAQPGAISGKVGLTRQQVGTLLSSLLEEGLVTKSGAGPAVRYELTA